MTGKRLRNVFWIDISPVGGLRYGSSWVPLLPGPLYLFPSFIQLSRALISRDMGTRPNSHAPRLSGKNTVCLRLSFRMADQLCRSDATDCGLNGDACRPFDGAFAFRCPAGCSFSMVLEPYTVGLQDINYQSLVIGGSADSDDPGIYRGDSFICPAALHAGLITDHSGGCGVLRRTGEQKDFQSVEKNGISSIPFASYFPSSFTFDRGASEEAESKCQDLRWPLFAFTVTISVILSLFLTTPAPFYTSMFVVVYFQVALSSDPPYSGDYYENLSISFGRFLPAAFVGYAIYYFCVRHTLDRKSVV